MLRRNFLKAMCLTPLAGLLPGVKASPTQLLMPVHVGATKRPGSKYRDMNDPSTFGCAWKDDNEITDKYNEYGIHKKRIFSWYKRDGRLYSIQYTDGTYRSISQDEQERYAFGKQPDVGNDPIYRDRKSESDAAARHLKGKDWSSLNFKRA